MKLYAAKAQVILISSELYFAWIHVKGKTIQNSNQNFGVQLGKLQKSLGRGYKFRKKSFLPAVDDV